MQSGSPFYHFKSKQALLFAVMEEGMRSAIERQQRALDAAPADLRAAERLRVQMQLIHEMVVSARQLGATTLLGIIPEHSPRLARRVGLDCVPVGPVMGFEGGLNSVCVSISMATKLH